MMPELLAQPIDSRVSSSHSKVRSCEAMQGNQRRPRSAPKTSSSNGPRSRHRSASPFQFWARRDGASHSMDRRRTKVDDDDNDTAAAAAATDDYFGARFGRASEDEAYVDSVSNHLGRLPAPTQAASGAANGQRDWRESLVKATEKPGPQPPITREEYMALPRAIQRKYFSALERVQFAKGSDQVDRIYHHYDLNSLNAVHSARKHRPALSSPDTLTTVPDHRHLRDGHASAAAPDDSWVLDLQHSLHRPALTREEQVSLVRQLRASVIIEAAGGALTTAATTRPPSTHTSLECTPDSDPDTPALSSRRASLDTMASAIDPQPDLDAHDPMRQSLYDSFRWLDEGDDLDLGLDLDEYHANLRHHGPQSTKARRPSFRRRLSTTQPPFGRSSSASPPPTREAPPSPPRQPAPNRPPLNVSQRRVSRTLSIMSPPKYSRSDAAPAIDPTTAHYQDPDARQRLRVYLVSPTKFDEAVQFGFPATDFPQRPATADSSLPLPHPTCADADNMRSFLCFDGDDDDELSVRDDASSLSDLDSPRTPQLGGGLTPPPGHHRPVRSPTDPLGRTSMRPQKRARPHKPNSSDSALHNAMSSREMTLRMTLTRPDLRANEELIYGWQPQGTPAYSAGRKSHSFPPRSEPATTKGQSSAVCWSEGNIQKMELESMLAGLDMWSPDHAAVGDKGVMKRLWKKVRRT